MHKMFVYLGLVEDDSYEEFDDDYETARRDVRSREPRGRGSDRYSDRDDDRYASRSVRTLPEPSNAVRTFRNDAGTRNDSSTRRTGSNVERRPGPPASERRPSADRVTYGISAIQSIQPKSYNDARTIGLQFREGVPVIMDLSQLEDADAKRLIDFAAGLIFGLHGDIKRLTNKVFVLSPEGVDVQEDARAQIAEDGFYNQS